VLNFFYAKIKAQESYVVQARPAERHSHGRVPMKHNRFLMLVTKKIRHLAEKYFVKLEPILLLRRRRCPFAVGVRLNLLLAHGPIFNLCDYRLRK
jgi:hypothetical protein